MAAVVGEVEASVDGGRLRVPRPDDGMGGGGGDAEFREAILVDDVLSCLERDPLYLVGRRLELVDFAPREGVESALVPVDAVFRVVIDESLRLDDLFPVGTRTYEASLHRLASAARVARGRRAESASHGRDAAARHRRGVTWRPGIRAAQRHMHPDAGPVPVVPARIVVPAVMRDIGRRARLVPPPTAITARAGDVGAAVDARLPALTPAESSAAGRDCGGGDIHYEVYRDGSDFTHGSSEARRKFDWHTYHYD